MKKLLLSLAVLAMVALPGFAQDCGGCDGAKAKTVKAKSGCCSSQKAKTAKLASKQDEKAGQAKKSSCCGSSCETAPAAKLAKAKTGDCGSSCSSTATAKLASAPQEEPKAADMNCGCGTMSTGCSDLDSYLALEKSSAKGCKKSAAKLAKMVKAQPKMPEVAKLYKNACNGCESSRVALAKMVAAKKAAPVAKKSCCDSTPAPAKLAKTAKSDCGSSCGSSCDSAAKATLATAPAKKSDCCGSCDSASKAKLATAPAKKSSCNGEGCESTCVDAKLTNGGAKKSCCASEKAKLAKTAKKSDCCGSCDSATKAKLATAPAKSSCNGEGCSSTCTEAKLTNTSAKKSCCSSEKAKLANKSECCGSQKVEGKLIEKKIGAPAKKTECCSGCSK